MCTDTASNSLVSVRLAAVTVEKRVSKHDCEAACIASEVLCVCSCSEVAKKSL